MGVMRRVPSEGRAVVVVGRLCLNYLVVLRIRACERPRSLSAPS